LLYSIDVAGIGHEMKIMSYQFPIATKDLYQITDMMRSRDVFTPSFDTNDSDVYDPLTYLLQKETHNTHTRLIADRNLLTRWENLGRSCKINEEHKIAAATLAFCQCCGILIEPNIALYEVASESGNEWANYEYSVFRVVDNTNPRIWVEIALGHNGMCTGPLAKVENLSPKAMVDFSPHLRVWRLNYVLALKIATLALKGGRSHILAEKLFEWMYSEYLFLAPATILALCYFSPNGPKKKLFKQIQSIDRERALSGIKNATWDLTLVHEWLRMVNGQAADNTLNLLGSLDKKLHTVARSMIAFTDSDKVVETKSRELFEKLWGNETSMRLYSTINEYYHNAEKPCRASNRTDDLPSIDELIADGEKYIREWQPA
jgi:hypothetical protein